MNPDVSGYVLTGGASIRMGRDKASLEFAGKTLGERAAETLSQVASRVAAVGYPIAGYRHLDDRAERKTSPASIFGVLAALRDSSTEWTALLACDLPFVTAELFDLLLEAEAREQTAAAVPLQPDGRMQPLAAIYRTVPCLAAINEIVGHGEFRLGLVLDTLPHRIVRPSEYSRLFGSDLFFINVNTPDDYRRALLVAVGR